MTRIIMLLLTFFMYIAAPSPALAAEELNIYSSRHYSTDENLYNDFTKKTGITINRVDGKDDALIARLQQEGAQSPADLFITVDAGRLWRAQEADLFTPIQSEILDRAIPKNLKSPKGYWFGFSTRARVIIYNKKKIDEKALTTYADLTNPEWKGKVCVRSSGNIYNQSLLASMVEIYGKDAAKQWAQGLLNNLARKPQGGDTDQIKAVAAGICDIALVNSYYFFRLHRSENEKDRAVVENLGIIFPNADTTGTHVNISGAGVLKHAKNKKAAIEFLEYLSSPSAQTYFADGNNEYPVVNGITVTDIVDQNKVPKAQNINVITYGVHQKTAKMIFDEIGFP